MNVPIACDQRLRVGDREVPAFTVRGPAGQGDLPKCRIGVDFRHRLIARGDPDPDDERLDLQRISRESDQLREAVVRRVERRRVVGAVEPAVA
jgi:hypothetical protein